MAPSKKALDSIKKAVSGLSSRAGLASRFPFLGKRKAASPEPFSAIEDETPVGDLLSAENAAHGMATQGRKREALDFRALIEAAVKKPSVLIGIFVVLAFLLALAVTPPLTEKGEALVKTWLPPPGDPLEPRMAMEREGSPGWTAEDAARLGINPDPMVAAQLRDKNDEAIDDLFRTVP